MEVHNRGVLFQIFNHSFGYCLHFALEFGDFGIEYDAKSIMQCKSIMYNHKKIHKTDKFCITSDHCTFF